MSQSQEISISGIEWLRPIWDYYRHQVEFEMRCGDWPNYTDLINLCKANPNLVEVYPNNQVTDENGQPAINSVRIKALGLRLLKEAPRQVHRQVTVDGEKIDVRSIVGKMLFTTAVPNLADACRIWLSDLTNERKATARRKVRILLSRAIGIRGEELAEHDPLLKAKIMLALALPTESESGIRERAREMDRDE